MEEGQHWHSTLYGLVPHAVEPRVLLLPGPDGWALPQARLDERVWPPLAAQHLHAALRRELGIAAPVLRCVQVQKDDVAHEVHAIFALENAQLEWVAPDSARWIDGATLADLPLARPEQRAPLATFLDEAGGAPVPNQRPPWARAGWFKPATAWIEAEARRLEYPPVAAIEYVKTCGISIVLRARTTAGDLYFKQAARLPLFADEPVLTAALARLFPRHVLTPVAIDAARGWMLLPDIGIAVPERSEVDAGGAAIRLWGEVQRASVGSVDALFAAGCLDRRLDVLEGQIDPLLDDPETSARMAPEELGELRRLAPQIKRLCRRLASYGLPPTLVHGDLHWGNIALKPEGTIMFDWTDSCIAHPFLDLATLLDLLDAFPEREAAQACLLDRYLAVWTDYAPLERLREAVDLAHALGHLHQAISYLTIINGLETASKDEVASGLPHFLRQHLRTIRAYLARRPS